MTNPPPANDATPPRWAERLLRLLLTPSDRDTITGDLLEEYREVIWPTRGAVGARRWYLRQALSLVLMTNSPAQWMIWLAAAGAMAVAFVMRYHVEPPFPGGGWAALAIGGSAALSLRPTDFGFLWRASVAFGVLFGTVAMTVSVAAALLMPVTDQHTVLMAYNGLRGRLFVVCCAAVFIAAGFGGAWRGRRVGTGILAAMGAGVVGATVWMGFVTGVASAFPILLYQLGPMSVFAWPVHPFNVTSALMRIVNNHLMLIIGSILPGVLGAMVGKGLCSIRDRRGTLTRATG